MKAKLYSIDSPDVPRMDLQTFRPSDAADVTIQIAAHIGAVEEPGENLFYFLFRTPQSFTREVQATGYLLPRGYLVMSAYNYDLLFTAIEELCSRIEGPNWASIAAQLSSYAYWEYED